MKKLSSLICFLLIGCIIHADQNFEGYYINNRGDTIKCTIIVGIFKQEPDYISVQNKIDIIVADNKRLTLIPDTAMEFVIKGYDVRKFISVKNDFGMPTGFHNAKKFVFLELLLDGYIKLYTGYYKDHETTSAGGSSFRYARISTKNYIQKGDNQIVEVEKKDSKFRDQMSKVLNDNPKLVQKINDNYYGTEGIKRLITEYNDSRKKDSVISNDTIVYDTCSRGRPSSVHNPHTSHLN